MTMVHNNNMNTQTGHWLFQVLSSSLQELIRRWDSERELLYDDNIHV